MQSIPSDVIQAFGSATAAAVCNTTSMYVDGKRYWPEGPTDILDPYYLSTAVISLLASMFVVVSFVKFKELRKHPSSLMLCRAIYDIVFASHFIAKFIIPVSDLMVPAQSMPACYVPTSTCQIMAAVFQYSYFGNIAYYLVLTVDLYLSLINPFVDSETYLVRYHSVATTVTFASVVIMLLSGQVMYRNAFGVCWFATQDSSNTTMNSWNWGLFFFPALIAFVTSIVALVWAQHRLRAGLPETLRSRKKKIQETLLQVFFFSVYMFLVGILYAVTLVKSRGRFDPVSGFDEVDTDRDFDSPLFKLLAVVIASRGFIDSCVWLANPRVRKLWWAHFSGDQASLNAYMQKDGIIDSTAGINFALRKEVLMYTTRGITKAIEMANELPDMQSPLVSALNAPNSPLYPSSIYPSDESSTPAIVTVRVPRGEKLDRQGTSIGLFDWFQSTDDRVESVAEHGGADDYSALSDDMPTSPSPAEKAIRLIEADHLISSSVKLTSSILSTRPRPVSLVPRSVMFRSVDGLNELGDAGLVPFNDFAPQVFRYLRSVWGIQDEAYVQSLRGNTDAMVERYTEGRSSSWFYFSEDNKYIVKTLEESEARLLVRILPQYQQYMAQNPDSFLCRFLGLHSITLYNMPSYFVVMQSVFLTKKIIHEKYDIKGSWVDRSTPMKTRGISKEVLKDMDCYRNLLLPPHVRARIIRQSELDSKFLASQNIMDYSMLIGIHHAKSTNSNICRVPLEPQPPVLQATSSPSLRSINAGKDSIPLSNFDAGRVGNTPANPMPFFQSGEDLGLSAQVIEGPSLYFMGIIDVLQEYNTSKKLEFFAKTSILCKDRNGVSCVEPDSYAPRFVKRLEEIIQACETGEDLENAEICEQRSRSVSFSAAAAAATSHHSQVQLDDV